MPRKAIFFDEGEGFLFVKALGKGVTGSAALVLSVSDGQYYVRKEEHDFKRDNHKNLERHQFKNQEVANAMKVGHVNGVAKVQGWQNYKSRKNGNTFAVSYWDYWASGTLSEMIDRSRERQARIPERWICAWLISMITTLINTHDAGIVHNDAHLSNWFLDRPDKHNIPTLGLGDFGHSTRREQESTASWRVKCQLDFLYMGTDLLALIFDSKASEAMKTITKILRDALNESPSNIADVKTLHQSMRAVRDRTLSHLKFTQAASRHQEELMGEMTPDSLHVYHSDDLVYNPKIEALKSFWVAEVSGNEIRVRGKPSDLDSYLSRAGNGDWTQVPSRKGFKVRH